MTEQRYIFDFKDNSYFNGRDVRVTDNQTGATILVNLKDDMWAVNVKDDMIRRVWPQDVQDAADAIDDPETQRCYERSQNSYWTWATELLPEAHGFKTVYQTGRSGGWLALGDSIGWEPDSLFLPEDHEEASSRDRFLALAFEAVAEIETYRNDFYEQVRGAATKDPLDQMRIDADAEEGSIEALLAYKDALEEECSRLSEAAKAAGRIAERVPRLDEWRSAADFMQESAEILDIYGVTRPEHYADDTCAASD